MSALPDCHLGDVDGEDELSDQEPHELTTDYGVIEVPKEVPEEENSIDGIPANLKNVWEMGKLEKSLHPQTGKKVWKCHFCNGMWSEWDHTKAVGHVTCGGRTSQAAR
jgi:hypothetical protein